MNLQTIKKEEIERIGKIPIVFIVGQGRSGTTLLQNLLDSHKGIIAPPLESKFIVLLYPRFAHISKWRERDILDFAKMLYIEPLFSSFWKINKDELIASLLSIKEHANYALLCKMVFCEMKKDGEPILMISVTNPDHSLFITTLLKIFPEAKFIHIIRDPRDNIYSHLITFGMKDPTFITYKWLGYNKAVEKAKLKMPSKFYTILYEKLVENTVEVMKSISSFLKIPYSDTMAQNLFQQTIKSYTSTIPTQIDTIHKSLLKPVNTKNIGKWKIGLSPYHLAITQKITGNYATEMYHYDMQIPSSDKVLPSYFTLFKYKLLYILWQAFTRLKFKSLKLNMLYSKLKRLRKGNELALWEYF